MSDLSTEVVQCPNCKEKVPKTLYCLNCGYPLYKMEQPSELEIPAEGNKPIEEISQPEKESEPIKVKPELDTKPVVEEVKQEPLVTEEKVDQVPEIITPAPEEKKTEEPKQEDVVQPEAVEPEIEKIAEATKPAIITEPSIEPVSQINVELKTPKIVEEAEQKPGLVEEVVKPPQEPVIPKIDEVKVEEQASEAAEKPELVVEQTEIIPAEGVKEEAPLEQVEPITVATSEPATTEPPAVKGNIEISNITEDTTMTEARTLGFVPDDYMRDVVEHVAKNLALKVRLAKLFREGDMKEETFKKLFTSYIEDGNAWNTRREELHTEVSEEIDRVGGNFAAAEDALELLEVRKTIGDASEEEYNVKLPAIKWELNNHDSILSESQKKLVYLEDIGKVLPEKELKELQETASTQYNTIDALQVEDEDLLAKVKDSLYEALKLLG